MKKKSTKILLIILVLFGIIKFSGGLSFFNVSTSGSEPNLKINSHFIGSSYVKLERLDFAYYKAFDSLFGEMIVVQRLIAMPNDTLQSVNGEFIVNGKNVDKDLNLLRMYSFSVLEYEKVIPDYIKNDDVYIKGLYVKDSIMITLNEDFVRELPFKVKLLNKYYSALVSKDIKSKTANWTISDFGPIILPEKKYFFVGDNRDNSIDSRERGFIDEESIKGTLLFKF